MAKHTTKIEYRGIQILKTGCAIVLLSLLLNGCSSLQFAYNRLDWLLAERIDDYISLNKHQEDRLEHHLEQQLRWHRHSQLPAYAHWLRRLQSQLKQELQFTDLDAHETELRAMYATLLQQLTPSAAELLVTLSDTQVAELLAALEERNRDYQSQWIDRPLAEQRSKRIDRTLEHSKRWLGDTSPQQRKRIEQWVAQLELSGPETLAYRQRWQNALRALLQERQQPDFERRLYELAIRAEDLQSAELRRIRQHNVQTFKQLLMDLYSLANSEQKRYLDQRLQTFADDFDELAAQ